jgi:two-component system, cell cycle sensor histidine kinase and response regulator CckA
MLYFPVSIAYTATNFVLATIIFIKAPKNQITRFYYFCNSCLVIIGVSAYVVTQSVDHNLITFIENIAFFLYALFPFFFIHFITFFVRQKDILKSIGVNTAIYIAGLFSYAMLLLGFIPRPITETGIITQSGYIFYITWMSVFFSIGIAMLFEISRGFRQKMWKANVVFITFALLILILPGPFTESVFFGILRINVEFYFYICTFALLIAVYFIFRHKINVNPVSDALKSALEVMNDIFITTNKDFHIEMIRGKAVKEIFGYSEQELIGKSLFEIIGQKEYLEKYQKFVEQKKMKESNFDADIICKNGENIPINFSFTPLYIGEDLDGFVTVGRDMSARRKLEEELRQAQKMESIGTLAGGIAHDFNNILQIIMVNTSSMRRAINDEKKLQQIAEINTNAVKRGSRLVQQILTFARKAEISFEPIDLNQLIQELIKMLSETFPKTTKFSLDLIHEPPHILGDYNQLNQVLMNLCVNARDAILNNGTISIKTEIIQGWEVKKKFSDADSERFICIQVIDTGTGMDEITRRRIFEPFFTTKEPGKGTGLGLSVVYGIVCGHSGFIDVASDLGVGTTFSIYIPVTNIKLKTTDHISTPETEFPRGDETLLIVEDEDVLLQTITALLSAHGYNIISARDGFEAVEVFKKRKEEIDLIILDIGLPKLSGWDALKNMKSESDSVKVIISSGYLDPKLKSDKLGEGVSEYILKPYEPTEILHSIRRVLDNRKN